MSAWSGRTKDPVFFIYYYKKDFPMKYDDELQSAFGMYQAYPFYPFLPWEDEKTRDQRRFRELYRCLQDAFSRW